MPVQSLATQVRRRLGRYWRRLFPPARPIARLSNDLAITRTIYGHKMLVDTRDMSLAPHILLDGYWEDWITRVFLQTIKPGMQVVDIGANLGYYSILAAASVAPNGRLYSFEANPKLAEIVFRNMHLNGFQDQATVINQAVYSETTSLTFNVNENYQGSSSLWEQDDVAKYWDSCRKISVAATRLDDYFPAGTRIDFMKIDAEGAEAHIFAGARRLFSENPQMQIIMEFAPQLLETAGTSGSRLYQDLHELGFAMYRIEHDASLTPLAADSPPPSSHCDMLLRGRSWDLNPR